LRTTLKGSLGRPALGETKISCGKPTRRPNVLLADSLVIRTLDVFRQGGVQTIIHNNQYLPVNFNEAKAGGRLGEKGNKNSFYLRTRR